jgi:phosphate transport system substrate-binding protein
VSKISKAANLPMDAAGKRRKRWPVIVLVVAGGLVAAACGSSTPSASKTTNHNKSKSTTTTSTTAASSSTTTSSTAAGATTTTAAPSASSTTKSTTATTAAVKTAAASTPGGVLGGSNDFNTPSAALTGAGSTFDQPLFSRQFYDFNKSDPKVTITYDAVGSGTGEADIEANQVQFGASDVPMQAADLAKDTAGNMLQIPVVLGGIALAYNVPGIGNNLHLTGPIIAGIYLGTITTWNDPQIAAANPGVNLPSTTIVPVHRSDSSGTTNAFTNYLSDVSPTWQSKVGAGKSVSWPGSFPGGSGNQGVAGIISGEANSIGYVELAYALQSGFHTAEVQNSAGSYVAPNETTVAAAAAQFPGVNPTNYLIVNAPGAGSYPISTYSWALVYQKQASTNTGIAIGKLLNWMVTAGQSDAAAIGYVPLPANVVALAESTILQMETASGAPLFTS